MVTIEQVFLPYAQNANGAARAKEHTRHERRGDPGASSGRSNPLG